MELLIICQVQDIASALTRCRKKIDIVGGELRKVREDKRVFDTLSCLFNLFNMASMEGETLEYLSLAAAHLPGNWSMAWPIQYYQDAEKTYHWLMSLGDPRVESWPLMATPWPTLTIALVYTLVCAVIPKQFKGVWRESLTPVLLIYNIFLVLLNVFIGKCLIGGAAASVNKVDTFQ